MSYRTQLARQLMDEAKRRDKLGHHDAAHDLRRAAADVAAAIVLLGASRQVKQ